MNRASRSTYGRRDFQFTSTAPQAARAFTLSGTYKGVQSPRTDSTVDTEAIKAITDEIANLKRRRQELEQPLQTAKKELETIEAQVSEIKAELVCH